MKNVSSSLHWGTFKLCEIIIAPILRRPVTVVLPRQQGWWEWLVNLAFFPLRFVINTTSELMQFVGEWYKHSPVEHKMDPTTSQQRTQQLNHYHAPMCPLC